MPEVISFSLDHVAQLIFILAGEDFDLYNWEQTYFCKKGPAYEMFARTALRSKNKVSRWPCLPVMCLDLSA